MTNQTEQIPAVTIEWIAQPGDVRRATLSVLRQRRFWLKALLIGLVVSVIAAVICIATGSGWLLGVSIGGAFFAGLALELILVCLLSGFLQNRKVLRAGARWAAGSDKARIRIDTPVLTMVIPRSNLESLIRSGDLVLLRLRPKQTMAVPAALLPGMLSDPGFAHLID